MSYSALHRMRQSNGLRERLTAAAAQEGSADPDLWVHSNTWAIVSDPEWVSAWTYAEGTATVNHNPDIGAREDVITDGMILSAIQARTAPQAPVEVIP